MAENKWVTGVTGLGSYGPLLITPRKSKTKQRMVFRVINVKDSLLPTGKVWSLDFQGTGRAHLLGNE